MEERKEEGMKNERKNGEKKVKTERKSEDGREE